MSKKTLGWIIAVVLVVVADITGTATIINIENGKTSATITLTENEVAPEVAPEIEQSVPEIDSGQGEATVDGEKIETVESVESNGPVTDVDNTDCPEGEECGRGASFPKLDISSPEAFVNATLGQCIDVDGYYGSQCWDQEAAFWLNYVGRTLTTCGTGAAKGTIQDGCWQQNAGNEFTMIWDKTQIQPGDIAVFGSGTWGHIGMATGYYNNGYFTLLGQNQGGKSCPNGGAAGNIINISTRDFIGAFRPNIYIKVEPQPQPTPQPTPQPVNNTVTITVKKGDTLGQILRDAGYTGSKLFGDSGLAQKVAEENKIKNRGLIYPKQVIVINKDLFNVY